MLPTSKTVGQGLRVQGQDLEALGIKVLQQTLLQLILGNGLEFRGLRQFGEGGEGALCFSCTKSPHQWCSS